MKPRGRSPISLTEQDLKMVKEYLESDKSLEEVARKYNTTKEGLRYKVKKFQKEQESNGKKEDN